jgi:hypothetical protein
VPTQPPWYTITCNAGPEIDNDPGSEHY